MTNDASRDMPTTDDLNQLIEVLPDPIRASLEHLTLDDLLEIVMDLGRPPEARFPGRVLDLSKEPVSSEDIDKVVGQVGEFGADNRAGIERTLHRISAIRNRKGRIIGLTLRVGRAVPGTVDPIRDLVETGKNILLLGRPGVGKTTMLREMARVLADELGKRVVVVDTSNEIGGDGDIPHPAIGRARRMQVPHPDQQHAVMIEAVENHMPEVIVIDEIGTEKETVAARTIAERGVQLIGTAHGNTLENLVMNPTLADLVGGVQTVTLGDEEARFRGTQKTITERKGPPTFDVVVEIAAIGNLVVHSDTASAVDDLLRGYIPEGESRRTKAETTGKSIPPQEAPVCFSSEAETARIYPYALSPDSVSRVIRDLRLNARVVAYPEDANILLALRSRGFDQRLQRMEKETGASVHLVKRNSTAQIRHVLQDIFSVVEGHDPDEIRVAVREAEDAVERVMETGASVELSPRPSPLRRLQHRIVARCHLVAESVGSEPLRHLIIQPRE